MPRQRRIEYEGAIYHVLTTLTLGEIAERSQMGSKKNRSGKFHQWRKTHERHP
jgi:hypothetical protein